MWGNPDSDYISIEEMLQQQLARAQGRIEELERQLDLAQQANRRLIQQLANKDDSNI